MCEGKGVTFSEDRMVRRENGYAAYIPVDAWHHHQNPWAEAAISPGRIRLFGRTSMAAHFRRSALETRKQTTAEQVSRQRRNVAAVKAPPFKISLRGLSGLLLISVLLLNNGCKPETTTAEEPKPLEVTVRPVVPHDVSLNYVYAGRVTAFRQVEVRARVSGILQQRRYHEGAQVKVGDVLFQIDRAPYEAAVQRDAARVRQQQAQRDKAQRDLKRASALLASQAGTILARDDALSALALADAGLEAAEADLRTQVLNLGYTTVIAPLSGATSLEAVPEGSVVGTGSDSSLLTRITQTDPIFVTFSFDPDDLAEIRRLRGTADLRLAASVLVDGKSREGIVDFTDSNMDQATGTVRGRALFDNGDDGLVPGQFVQVVLSGLTLHEAPTVPKIAVGQDATGTFVFLAENGRARRVDIRLKQSAGSDWVVSGVRSGDLIVTEGLVHLREGSRIRVAQQ
jgi:membrane fusion protein (multidrug efflux system)